MELIRKPNIKESEIQAAFTVKRRMERRDKKWVLVLDR